MLDYSIEIKDDIVITIKKPVAPQEQLEQLEIMKDMLLLHEFIHWISFLPIDPTKEEWGYWEAKAGHLDPIMKEKAALKNLKEINIKLIDEIVVLEMKLKELKTEKMNMEKRIENIRLRETSQAITLETEIEKLKNKVAAYEHQKKKGDGKNGGKRKNIL